MMRALTGHPSLQEIDLSLNLPPDPTAAGALLGALLAADSPALRELRIRNSERLGDAGMRPLLQALARNTHLRELDCCDVGIMSEQFAQGVFLPAVRANTGLRKLAASEYYGDWVGMRAPAAVLEAEALVAARSDPAAS